MTVTAAAPPATRPAVTPIGVPLHLPVRHDGRRIDRLSHTSVNLFIACPDAWRRRYLLGERTRPTGGMILGRAVDDALSDLHRNQMAGIEMNADQCLDAFRDAWNSQLEEEADRDGVTWEEALGENTAFAMGLRMIDVALIDLVPRMGTATHVQREFTRRLAPGATWSLVGYLDLETVREQVCWTLEDGTVLVQDTGEEIPTIAVPWDDAPAGYRIATYKGGLDDRLVSQIASLHLLDELDADQIASRLDRQLAEAVPGKKAGPRLTQVRHVIDPPPSKRPDTVPIPVTEFTGRREPVEIAGIADYKMKGRRLTQARADTDMQASIYLAERALTGRPAHDFRFAQIIRDEHNPVHAITQTTRTAAQMRAALLRVCMVAAQIDACHRTFGAEAPWGFAAPDHWKCRMCDYAPTCPMGEAR
jgi:hypothetical protein